MIEGDGAAAWRGVRRAAVVRVRLSPPYLSRPPPDAHARRAPPPVPRRVRAMPTLRQQIYVHTYLYFFQIRSVGRSPEMRQ